MNRVGFALLSNSRDPAPSTRVACLNLFPHLRKAGLEPDIVFDPVEASEVPAGKNIAENALARGARIVVFQKIHGPSVLQAIARLRGEGIGTVYCSCDWVDNEMAAATDATIVPTSFLKSLYLPELQHRVHVAHDAVERPEISRQSVPRTTTQTLVGGLVTSHQLYCIPVLGIPPGGWRVEVIGRFPPAAHRLERVRSAYWAVSQLRDWSQKIELVHAILHPRIQHAAWDPEGVYERLREADIGIIPIDTSTDVSEASIEPSWKVKSENRLTLKMALGLPVIATPIPSYEAVLQHGENGFFARSRKDWLDCLNRLRDPDLRREMGIKARQSVVARYSIDAQAQVFIAVLRRVMPVTSPSPSAARQQFAWPQLGQVSGQEERGRTGF